MNYIKCFKLLLIICLISFITTGCWDLKDIDQRSIIIAIGIDFAETPEGSNYEHSELIKLTAQIAIPQKLGGGAGQPPAMGEESVWNVSAVGLNISMAIMQLNEKLQYEIFLGHVRAIIFSEDVAKEGILRYLNYFRNNPDFRRLSYIMISEDKAEDVLNTYPKTAIIQGVYLMNMVETAVKKGNMPDIPFIEFVIRLVDKGIDPVAIMINSFENKIKFSGLAVFKGERMVGKMNIEEGWSFIQLAEKKQGGFEVVRDVKDELGRVTIFFSGIQSNLRPMLTEDDNFLFKVDLDFEGRAISQETPTDYSNQILFNELEQRVSNEVKRELEVLFYKIQKKYNSDIFGFGEMVRAYMPKEWDKIDNWREKFRTTKLDITVRTKIRRIGMTNLIQ